MLPFSTIPRAALWLGLAGLLPFAAAILAGALLAAPFHELAHRALIGYGAVILSFLGGVRWGVAMVVDSPAELFPRLGFSVLPALGGWTALLLPTAEGLMLLALGFALMLFADRRFTAAPGWYRRLRLPLSVGAICALMLGLLA